jgi:hypothetical protein
MTVFFLWFCLSAMAEQPVDAPDGSDPVEVVARTAVEASLVLKVGAPLEAQDSLVAKARELGGWFQERSQEHVSLRVPTEQHEALLAFAAELGRVTDRTANRQDLTAALVDRRGRLTGRQEGLARYHEVLVTASAGSVVAVERQIVRSIEEIERLKGEIQVLEDRAAHARLTVWFRFRDRAAPVRDGSSSFAWLNTLNVSDVVEGMQRSWVPWRTRGVVAVAPDGFSSWRNPRRFRAVSADGVLYRVRSVAHEPVADVSFWSEAVRERMDAAGYGIVAESAVGGGVAIELVSPLGQEDWTYEVAFFLAGDRIVIAEAAGEVSRFEARRGAVRAAMEALGL